MIRPPSDLTEAQALLRQLGYGIQPVAVSSGAWPDALPQPLGSWWYAGSYGSLDIHLLETESSDDGEATLRALTSWNAVRTQALVRLTPAESRLIVGRHGRRISALRLAGNRNDEEVARRLESLQRKGRESRDPAILFEQALESDSTGRRFFQRFREAIDGIARATAEVTRDPLASCEDHALLIMSRLLFLCFVQRKGWLAGDSDFLGANIVRFVDRGLTIDSFFSALFFGSLNTPAGDRGAEAAALGQIPYLNGGLFEPSKFEVRHAARLNLPDQPLLDAFRRVFSVFDFSVHEDSEDATAIDPEMLGRVFEALMSSEERSASGSFYTPPAIVDRIVIQALLAQLARTPAERIWLEEVMLGVTADAGLGGKHQATLRQRASELRVLDPACGSGAFLLAALHALEHVLTVPGAESRAELRRRIVENQLYGIDRKAEAIRLCELRLWLSIVAAEDDVRRLQPLPNLDRNIVQGDSLLSPLEVSSMGDIRGIQVTPDPDLEIRYRTANGEARRAIRRELRRRDQTVALELIKQGIEAVRRAPRQSRLGGGLEPRPALLHLRRLRRSVEKGVLPFDWRVHFSDVAAAGGFDLLVGNPPWVRRAALDADTRQALQRRYSWFAGEKGKPAQSDVWVAFLQRFSELCRVGGVIGILLPEKLLSASYARRARRTLRREHRLLWMERKSRRVFDADTFPLALVVAKAAPHPSATVEVDGATVRTGSLSLSADADDRWLLVPAMVREALEKISCSGQPLGRESRFAPHMGVKTGANSLFLRQDVATAGNGEWIVDGVRVPPEGIVRLIRGRDLDPDGWRDGHWMLWPPGLIRMSRRRLDTLSSRIGCETSRLLSLESIPQLRGRSIVAWKDLALRLNPVVLPAFSTWKGRRIRLIPSQTLYCIAPGNENDVCALTAFLRSTPAAALAAALADPAKDRHRRYFGTTIGAIPLPESLRTRPVWQSLVRLGRGASKLTDLEIDRIVADACALTRKQLRELALWLSAELHGL